MELIEIILKREEKKRKRAQFIIDNQEVWKTEGAMLKNWREDLAISPTKMAKDLGVGYARVKNLEEGNGVDDAKLLYQAYVTRLQYIEQILDIIRLMEEKSMLQEQLSRKTITVEMNGYKIEVPAVPAMRRRDVI